MTSRITHATLSRPAAQAGGATAGAVACLEVSGFPQILYTRSFGDPDMLFVPLLDASRESCRMAERLRSQGEDPKMAVTLSTMQLVSTLLQDASFTVVARGTSHENLYRVDFDEGTVRLSTRLYAVISHRTSFFRVEIAGKIMDGQFVVRSPGDDRILMQLKEEELRTPNFFSSVLAPGCLRAQMERERFGLMQESEGRAAQGEVRMTLAVRGNKIPVILKYNGALGRWDVVHGTRQECVGSLSTELEESLERVIRFLDGLFT